MQSSARSTSRGATAGQSGYGMFSSIKRSLLLRIGFAFGLIAALALFGIISSVVIAEMLRGEAAAINRAGALRMQTYAIGTELLAPRPVEASAHRARVEAAIARFEMRYLSESLTRALPGNPSEPVRAAYDEVGRSWENDVRPLLDQWLLHPPDAQGYTHLRDTLDSFVARVDRMVVLLEQKAEAKVQLLRFTQGISLFLTLVVIYITMYFMRTEVMQPLRDLLDAAEAARRQDFSHRIRQTGEDELGRLGATFNLMAEDLSRTYEELERRVLEKTQALERGKRSLEIMYHSLIHLNESGPVQGKYGDTLREMEQFLGLGPGSVCLVEHDGRRGFRVASTDPGDAGGGICNMESCVECVRHGQTRLARGRDGSGRVLNVPLREDNRVQGILTLHVPEGVTLESWKIHLVEGVAQHLAAAIGKQRRVEQDRRLALLEERATIARELHDSLAQALTYQKIQVSRLQSQLKAAGGNAQAEATIQDLRKGLNDAYRELRELLTTFRIRMDEEGLNRALEDTVTEFAQRGQLDIILDNRVAD